jgi:hypothetical protein
MTMIAVFSVNGVGVCEPIPGTDIYEAKFLRLMTLKDAGARRRSLRGRGLAPGQ